jgi:hypothetical protein
MLNQFLKDVRRLSNLVQWKIAAWWQQLEIPTKVRQYSAIKYPIYSGAKYASQTGL